MSSVVLTLIISFVAALVNSAANTTNRGHTRMDTDEQARVVMERMGLDFKRLVLRSDVDFQFIKHATTDSQDGNDEFYFYANTEGYAGDRGLSVVGYRVDPGGTNATIDNTGKLERGVHGLFWSAAGGTQMAFAQATPSPTPATSPSAAAAPTPTQSLQFSNTLDQKNLLPTDSANEFQVLSDNVFRLEFSFLLKGSQSTNPVVSTAMTDPMTGAATLQIQSVAAIIVTIAVLDGKSQALLTDTARHTLQTAFPDAVAGQNTASTWSTLAGQPAFAAGLNLSPALTNGIRIYQRYFYLGQ